MQTLFYTISLSLNIKVFLKYRYYQMEKKNFAIHFNPVFSYYQL